MGSALELLSGVMVLAGALFCVIGGVGLLRLPEFFSRSHAASISDTLGAGLILIGLVVYEASKWLAPVAEGTGSPEGASVGVILKLLLLLSFIYVVGPTAIHALAKAAFSAGVKAKPTPGASAARGSGNKRRGSA